MGALLSLNNVRNFQRHQVNAKIGPRMSHANAAVRVIATGCGNLLSIHFLLIAACWLFLVLQSSSAADIATVFTGASNVVVTNPSATLTITRAANVYLSPDKRDGVLTLVSADPRANSVRFHPATNCGINHLSTFVVKHGSTNVFTITWKESTATVSKK